MAERLRFSAWNDIYDLVEAQSGKQVFSETHVLLKDREKNYFFLKKNNKKCRFFIESIDSKVNIPLKLVFKFSGVNMFQIQIVYLWTRIN